MKQLTDFQDNTAVHESMRELENLAAVRVRAGENVRTNNCENTGKIIYAEFMHDTSRALDPQLHTHNVVCNVTLTSEGKYKALETLEMCRAIRYAGKVYHCAILEDVIAIFQKELPQDISKRLAFPILSGPCSPCIFSR